MGKKKILSEWYHKLLEKADIVDGRYPVKGMLIYRGWGLHIIKEMQYFLEKLLNDSGHEPVLFPVLIPEDILGKETKHIAGFEEEVYWVTHAGKNRLDRKMSLRPTSETPIYEMFKLWIRSHTDLPYMVQQSCAVYRYETKHTRPLIRGREFLWNEGHSAHLDADDVRRHMEMIDEIYSKLIGDLLCIPYVVSARPEWDRFPGASETRAFDTLMPDGRTLQVATIHDLGQNFSKAFGLTYENEDGQHKLAYTCSYGPSFGRLLASVICIHGDDIGLILPPAIAPVQVIIIPVVFKESEREAILSAAGKLSSELKNKGVRVKVDDGDERPGAKYFRWEMRGVPLRIELGPRELKQGLVTVVRRDTGEKKQVSLDKLDVELFFKKITSSMRDEALKRFNEGFFSAGNLDELRDYAGKGIIKAGWCGKSECADSIEECADILSVDVKKSKCVVCGLEGVEVSAAKTY
ncbi:MAG: proline--tRNA ligase [Candidatus Altiarchaeales archaeon ex4484_96]|nr:MAG: proline--tRNA ligase [Candidatus Altiarchaeales archaeon ex4484_96]